jgi:D-3-phosphoglycerate dehydrogenase / 2-oxoglutarate reductase
MMRILITEMLDAAGLEKLDRAGDVAYDLKTGLSKTDLLALIPQYAALIVRSATPVDADLIQAGSQLKVIGRAGAGVENIDVHAATRAGIVVMNTPGANSIATAEQTLALMLAVTRHTHRAHAALLAGKWERTAFVGSQLHGKTLGVVGFGHVGRLVAQRAQAFGMQVIACDPYISEEVGRAYGVLLVDLDDLLAQADVVTLHAALRPETERLIDAAALAQMQPGAVLINAARGRLVDEAALAAALQSGRLKAAALDVFASEPPAPDNPLIGLPNVLHTPHLGDSTQEAQREVATQIVEQVLAALRGVDYVNSLNMPFTVRGDFARIRPYMELAEKLGVLHAGLADKPIRRVEVEVKGDVVEEMVRAVAAAILKGILSLSAATSINTINAPLLAHERGIEIAQTSGINGLDYPNLISCRAIWDGGERTLAGVLFGGSEPRIAQMDQYRLEARPEGFVLVMQNRDVPGVIGQVGTILAAYEVNIGEWRLGRNKPGGQALSFINLDSRPPDAVLDALGKLTAVTQLKLVTL